MVGGSITFRLFAVACWKPSVVAGATLPNVRTPSVAALEPKLTNGCARRLTSSAGGWTVLDDDGIGAARGGTLLALDAALKRVRLPWRKGELFKVGRGACVPASGGGIVFETAIHTLAIVGSITREQVGWCSPTHAAWLRQTLWPHSLDHGAVYVTNDPLKVPSQPIVGRSQIFDLLNN